MRVRGRNNKKHGKGTFTWEDGDKYVGEWWNDKRHGKGTFTWEDGDKYVGEYKDGHMYILGTNLTPVNIFKRTDKHYLYVRSNEANPYDRNGTKAQKYGAVKTVMATKEIISLIRTRRHHRQGSSTYLDQHGGPIEWK